MEYKNVKVKKDEDRRVFTESRMVSFIGNLRCFSFCSAMSLKLYYGSKSPRRLSKTQIAKPDFLSF